jgi:hypothetical protein
VRAVDNVDKSVDNEIEISVCTNKSGWEADDEELKCIINEFNNKWTIIKDVYWELNNNRNMEKYLKRALNL